MLFRSDGLTDFPGAIDARLLLGTVGAVLVRAPVCFFHVAIWRAKPTLKRATAHWVLELDIALYVEAVSIRAPFYLKNQIAQSWTPIVNLFVGKVGRKSRFKYSKYPSPGLNHRRHADVPNP